MILRFLSYLDGTFQEEQAKQDIIFYSFIYIALVSIFFFNHCEF